MSIRKGLACGSGRCARQETYPLRESAVDSRTAKREIPSHGRPHPTPFAIDKNESDEPFRAGLRGSPLANPAGNNERRGPTSVRSAHRDTRGTPCDRRAEGHGGQQ